MSLGMLGEGVELYLHPFLTLACDRGERLRVARIDHWLVTSTYCEVVLIVKLVGHTLNTAIHVGILLYDHCYASVLVLH